MQPTIEPTIANFGLTTLGTMGIVDLIAATTNAFNGALLARRPDHYKHFTLIGVILLGYAGGIGGGILRDILCNKVPSPLVDPWYLIFCFAAGGAAVVLDYYGTQKFRDGLFQFMTAFSLPWYAIVGAQTAVDTHLGYVAAVLIGVIATTGGRWIIDVASNVVPKQLVRGEFFVLAAALTALLYLVCHDGLGWSQVAATIVAFFFGFAFRITCLMRGWEEWEPWAPQALQTGEKTREPLTDAIQTELERNSTKDA